MFHGVWMGYLSLMHLNLKYFSSPLFPPVAVLPDFAILPDWALSAPVNLQASVRFESLGIFGPAFPFPTLLGDRGDFIGTHICWTVCSFPIFSAIDAKMSPPEQRSVFAPNT